MGLYWWIIEFDRFLLNEQFTDCREIWREMITGGYDLTLRERRAIDERESAFRLKKDGLDALASFYEEQVRISQKKDDQNYLADLLFRFGLICHKLGNTKMSQKNFLRSKEIKEALGKTAGVGRVVQLFAVLETDGDEAQKAFETIWKKNIEGGRDAAEVISDFLWDSNWRTARDAVIALEEIGAVAELGDALLRHSSPRVRLDALIGLGKINTEEAVGFIIKSLSDDYWLVRRRAALALGGAGDSRSENALLNSLSDPDIDVKMAVIESIEKTGGNAAKEMLQMIFNSPEAYDTLERSLRRKARNAFKNLE